MKRPEVTIDIDELVLSEVPAAARVRIGTAISMELQRLIAQRGVPIGLRQRNKPALGADLTLDPAAGADRIGVLVAQAIYKGWEAPVRSQPAPEAAQAGSTTPATSTPSVHGAEGMRR